MNAPPEWIGRLHGTEPPTARTLRDLEDTRYSWWTTAEAAAAAEEWHRDNFDEFLRARAAKPSPWAIRVGYFMALGAFVLLALKFLKH